jgi:CubicO group peptidase (beta-lactamase class C family)
LQHPTSNPRNEDVVMESPQDLRIEGFVRDDFEQVRTAFIENFVSRGELGAACSIQVDGETVVDLWAGVRDRRTRDPWRPDTMTIVHSTTKGFAAMVMAVLHSRELLDYDERVATYWPEFAQNGKEHITVRQLLAHQAGLYAFDEKVDLEVVADLDRLADIMARQRPMFEPGTRQAYHAITLGFYMGELVRRIDPGRRTLGRFFDEEIAKPLNADIYIRTPESIPISRIAHLEPPSIWKRLTGMPIRFTLAALDRRSVLHRALISNPGTAFYLDPDLVIRRNLEAPSGGAIASARGIARVYGAFASGGLGLRRETIDELMAPARPSANGFHDDLFRGPAKFSLGFMKPNDSVAFAQHASAFGAPGAGGSMGYADPEAGIGYGYVTNRMGTTLSGDPRDVALRHAIPSAPRRQRTPPPPLHEPTDLTRHA